MGYHIESMLKIVNDLGEIKKAIDSVKMFDGDTIIYIRMLCRLTQKELADKMGCTQQYISNIESGKVKISYRLLFNLSDNLLDTLEKIYKKRR